MKNYTTLLLIAVCTIAQAQIEIPAPSPAGSVYSKVGLTDVKVTYSRPRVKGRKVFGAGDDVMHKYGEIWRTGANNGTVISFSDDVKVEGKDVKKGEYLVLTIPGATEWTVILYGDVSMGGNVGAYDQTKDVARFSVKAEKPAKAVETFTIGITDISEDNKTANVQLGFENAVVNFKVAAEYEDKVQKSIEANTKVSPGNYITAANYYFNTGKDLKKALEWMDMGIAQGNPNAFWNIHTKAKIQKALGDKAGAVATAQKSLDLAKSSENDFGYIKLNEDLIKSLK
jgi:hypothetical protein